MRGTCAPLFLICSMDVDYLQYLESFLTENRKKRFIDVLSYRTQYLTLVIEDIFYSQNASAVLRTSECYGVMDVHVIENRNEYQVNPDVAIGASKWINLHKYSKHENNTLEAISTLKQKGYRVVATSPHENGVSINDLDLEKGKIALVFGNEKIGISDTMKKEADEFVTIPMHGFTESFNISVAAGISLQTLIPKLHNSNISWQLDELSKQKIYMEWVKKTIKNVELIEERYYAAKR